MFECCLASVGQFWFSKGPIYMSYEATVWSWRCCESKNYLLKMCVLFQWAYTGASFQEVRRENWVRGPYQREPRKIRQRRLQPWKNGGKNFDLMKIVSLLFDNSYMYLKRHQLNLQQQSQQTNPFSLATFSYGKHITFTSTALYFITACSASIRSDWIVKSSKKLWKLPWTTWILGYLMFLDIFLAFKWIASEQS